MIKREVAFRGIATADPNISLIENGSITSVKGFKAAGVHCGLKKRKKDLALLYSEHDCTIAGTFTLNKVQAAPLIICKQLNAKGGFARAVLINSGIANTCTGPEGVEDAYSVQEYCAQKLGIPRDQVFIGSTGVIGKRIPVDIIKHGVDMCSTRLSTNGGIDAAEAIRTTDKSTKHAACRVQLSNGTVTIGMICKGSGMIMPNMATMLAFISTDAEIDKELLQTMLSSSVKDSFNKISVDGDTSTNDMVLVLANGVSGIRIKSGTSDAATFGAALFALCKIMARSIAADGEGATKLITVTVRNAASVHEADLVCSSIANSPLVKTAIHGGDPNWGRIFSAAGKSKANFTPEKVSIWLNDTALISPQYRVCLDLEKIKDIFNQQEVVITMDLQEGAASSTWWTCDFSKEYVHINASYTS